MHTFDLTLDRLTKVEGSAALDIRVCENKVEYAHFKITEYKRFFTTAMKGKPIAALPQLLARICGTCSNAHLLASIEACEKALGITPSEQTIILRDLTMHGLIIRDHALHLYLFSLPDIYGKDAFLDFDENDPEQHQLLHDAFDIKAAGNFLATLIAGRSVHAIHPTIGGYLHFPDKAGIEEAVAKLQAIRPAVLRLIKVFEASPFHFDRKTNFMALVPENHYGYLAGSIKTSLGGVIPEEKFREHLERVVLPYSQASAYRHKGEAYMVGSLARMNLAKDLLHHETKASVPSTLDKFPSTDIYFNNIAQAVEILHSVDEAIEVLSTREIMPEPVVKTAPREAVGVGVVEAPRGTLYHKVAMGDDGIVKEGEVIVPTGQNQANIEEDIARLVEELIPVTPKEKIGFEIEKLIRAYDPCMSCATHFLKVSWL
ncbi:MAG: Hydrogenase/sulfur reductase, alpha subunit [Parcubacteria group bacterium GW2011_GWC2_52_8c]|nr:MAG: Hydrogenase/sulfur reductase, alpha subunit [Parcubacteria group bacterium GW2011_GWA1_51_12]KKW31618.1 MAG: Hydrogenase/sulfur reductase, alpha subunit [Parcubacteria group bacterium GW2011_GWC2_52_8c]